MLQVNALETEVRDLKGLAEALEVDVKAAANSTLGERVTMVLCKCVRLLH